MQSTSAKQRGNGCLLLFGLPFLAVGIAASWILISQLLQLHQMQGWQETPARILESRLVSSRGSKSTTYSVEAKYEYTYQDRRYESERVSIDFGSDNVDSFPQNAADELGRYSGTDRLFRCYVNPANPAEAVLYRDPRPAMLAFIAVFAVLFGAVGGGIVLGAVWPSASGRGREEWRRGRITCSSKNEAFGISIFALLWNALTAPIVLLIGGQLYQQLLAGKLSVLFLLIFPLLGVVLLAIAGYAVLSWRKFGKVVLSSPSFPVPPGGRLSGILQVAGRAEPADGFTLTLQCVERVTTGSGKNRSRRESVIWEETRKAASSRVGSSGQTTVAVDFLLPAEAAPTQGDANNGIVWRLQASAEVPGVDFYCQFEIPVLPRRGGKKEWLSPPANLPGGNSAPG